MRQTRNTSSNANRDEFKVKKVDVEKIIDWENTSPKQVEIPFKPARVLLQVLSFLLMAHRATTTEKQDHGEQLPPLCQNLTCEPVSGFDEECYQTIDLPCVDYALGPALAKGVLKSLASDIVLNFQEYEASAFQRKMERRCIYKCPYGLVTIKNLKGKHIPHMVSLGPYHHGEEQLQPMDFHKRRALHGMTMENHTASHSPGDARQQLMHHLIPFMNCLSKVEVELRDCYDQLDPKWSSSTAFLEMLLLDGCFILKLLRCTEAPDNSNSGSDSSTTSDPIFGPNVSPYIRSTLRRDMLMLENQIPLLVLERLLHIENDQRSSSCIYTYLNKLIINFFDFKFSDKPYLSSRRGLHILDIYRECLIRIPKRLPNQVPNPSTRESPFDTTCFQAVAAIHCLTRLGCQVVAAINGRTLGGNGLTEEIEMRSQSQLCTGQVPVQTPHQSQDNIVLDCSCPEEMGGDNPQGRDFHGLSNQTSSDVPCAKRLQFAGVTFKKSIGGWLSDVHFDEKSGVLSLPFLKINDDTMAKFMNLIAFEQVHPRAGGQVTSYFEFMDALLDTGEDMCALISKGIVRNELGSDDAAAKLVNSLGDGAVDVQNDGLVHSDEVESVRCRITEVRKKLNAYASSNWNTWIADLEHKYFSSPWACMSLLAAIFLIFLTIVQTAYTVLGFYKGPAT